MSSLITPETLLFIASLSLFLTLMVGIVIGVILTLGSTLIGYMLGITIKNKKEHK